jgi:hypothetical protein
MSNSSEKSSSLMSDIMTSFLALPHWVNVWLLVVLGPVNMASLFFLSQPEGPLIASLVVAGMVLSLIPVPFERGLSKLTAVGHLLPWTILILHIFFARPDVDGIYDIYLTVLAVVNTISLAFDYPDSYKWLKGDRAVAGRVKRSSAA